MDALDKILPAASELLSRSDSVLARAGAPAGHEILRLLRLAGRLPADMVAEMADWRPAPLSRQAEMLTRQAEQHRALADQLSGPIPWEGRAANAFGARLGAVIRQSDDLASSASSLATQLTELAAWVQAARLRLAHTLASVLRSAEAVTLSSPTASQLELAEAALRIAAAVLRDTDLFREACQDFAATWPRPEAAPTVGDVPPLPYFIRAEGLA